MESKAPDGIRYALWKQIGYHHDFVMGEKAKNNTRQNKTRMIKSLWVQIRCATLLVP